MGVITTKIIRGTLFLSVASFISRFTAFLSVIVVTRGLSLFEYGVVTLVLSITGPVNSISGLGLDELIVSDVSKSLGEGRKDYAKKLLSSFFKIRFLIIALLAIIGWFFRASLEARYGPAISQYFFLVMLLIFIQFIRNAFTLIFQIHQRFGTMSSLFTLEVLARFLVILVFLKFYSLNIFTVLLSYVIAAAIPILITFPYLFKTLFYFASVQKYSGSVIWPILSRHGKWQMGLDIASSIISNVRYWLIKIFLNTETVAIFSVAQSMYSAVASLLPMKSVMFPIIAEKSNNPSVMKQLVARSTKYSLFFYGLLMVAALVVAPFFIKIFFPKYLAGILIFQIMALRLPMNAFSISQAPLLIILKEQRYVFLLALVNAASVLIFSPILMVFLGLKGAVLEGLITVLLVIILREIFLRRRYAFPSLTIRSFFTIDQYDKMILNRIKDKFFKRNQGLTKA